MIGGPSEDEQQARPRRPRRWTAVAAIVAVVLAGCADAEPAADEGSAEPPVDEVVYLDAAAPLDARVSDLLGRMTLDEKVGQMTLVEKGSITPDELAEYHVGAVLSGGGGAPRPNAPEAWREMVGAYQDAALSTRLGIPMLYGVDAVHGHNNLRGAVIFPHNVGLGAAGDAALVESIARATAVETAATGIRWNYSPVLAVPQDIRWGRTYEAFGEDPELVTTLGAAMVRGMQGDDLSAPSAVVATPKHWVGDGGTGWDTSIAPGYSIDQGVTLASEQELRDIHVAPYPASFAAGAVSVMASYSSWENGKVHGDRFLLTEVLRGELGFDGFVVSDWGAVDQVDPGDYYGSVAQSINAGIDLVMVPTEFELFQTALRGAVEQGDVAEARIDEAVARILEVKFSMGLFEQPMPPEELVDSIGSAEHRDLARRAVAASAVLLETDGEVLPIDPGDGPLLVAGRAADDIGIQSGGWTISWQGDTGEITDGTTIVQGLNQTFGDRVLYDRFGRFDDRADGPLAPVGIAVVGERPYAEGRGDSSTLALPDRELDVIRRLSERVERLVVVLVTGRPLVLAEEFDVADALVVAWLPGSEGAGIVDVLDGTQAFGGRLPLSWPLAVDVLDRGRTTPCDGMRYPYGYGLETDGTPLPGAVPCLVGGNS